MDMNLNKMNNKMNDTAGLAITGINKKQDETEEETANNECNIVVATISPTHVSGNNRYQAVIAKYCTAWQEIKQYPNTCKYFEPTESQLWLIVQSGYTAKDAFETAGDHDCPCCSCMEKQ